MRNIGRGTFAELASYVSEEDPAAELRAFRRASKGAFVQALDLEAVGGEEHVLLALKQTVELKRSQLLAKKPEVDFLLRVAGTGQIAKAVEIAGAKPASRTLLVSFGPKAAVARALESIGRTKELRAYSEKAPGRKAAARVGPLERSSAVGPGDPIAKLLAERASLLHR
ncbi:MAG TPA: KEOPS complex subunit Cgi121 [Conexivisphaerales archaeon]|nr:KEOPS complex subunit Cgi121 [Conexivisphaerales archaeon]